MIGSFGRDCCRKLLIRVNGVGGLGAFIPRRSGGGGCSGAALGSVHSLRELPSFSCRDVIGEDSAVSIV